jgi:hypothetical protein
VEEVPDAVKVPGAAVTAKRTLWLVGAERQLLPNHNIDPQNRAFWPLSH